MFTFCDGVNAVEVCSTYVVWLVETSTSPTRNDAVSRLGKGTGGGRNDQ
jgi:hypothetical protein